MSFETNMTDNADSSNFLLDMLSQEEQKTLDQIHENRHEVIQQLWENYERGVYTFVPDDQPETTIELIKPTDLHVVGQDDIMTGELCSIDVTHDGAKNLPGVNFMGFDPKQQCLAFRGEARHWDLFMDFANHVVREKRVQTAFKAPATLVIPEAGFKRNLKYDDFASQVEIVEYAMWLKPPTSQEEAAAESPDPLVIVSPNPNFVLGNAQLDSHARKCDHKRKEIPMDINDENPEPPLSNSKIYSTDSSLSDIPEEEEDFRFDSDRRGNSVMVADQDCEMIDGAVFEAGPCRHHDVEEADKVASQLEADAALAVSLSESLTNTARYTLRRRNSTKGAEQVAITGQKSNSEQAEAGRENERTSSTASIVKQPRKKAAVKKTSTMTQTRKNNLRRRQA